MKTPMKRALVSSAMAALCASSAVAQSQDLAEADARILETGSKFSWEGSLEIANDQVFKSDDAANEIRDTYLELELDGEYAFSDSVAFFAGLTAESVTDAVANRSFEDIGLYVRELGLRFAAGNGEYFVGKVTPVFGTAWDSAAGFYGGTLAEDYELTEQLGALADFDMGNGNTLSMGLFFADNSVLSESAFTNRGRNSEDDGGAGNTGKLNNAAVQWTKEWDSTFAYVGARYLNAGTGDAGDEKGVVAGIGHEFGIPLYAFAEVASFQNWGGSTDDATYATLNALYTIGDVALSGTYARRDIDSEGVTNLYSIAAEYQFDNDMLIGAALAQQETEGVKDQLVGLNIVIPFGG